MMTVKLFKTALIALRVNVLRSFLTMLGIIIGVSAVIIMVALGAGAQREVDAQIEALGGNIFMLMGSFRRMGGAATAAGSVQSLTADHADAARRAAAEHCGRRARDQRERASRVRQSELVDAGHRQRQPLPRHAQLDAGRLAASSRHRKSQAAARSRSSATPCARSCSAKAIRSARPFAINKLNATVIGLLEPKGQDLGGQDQDDVVLMPLRTVRTRLTGLNAANPNAVQRLIVKVHDGENLDYARGRHRRP